MNRFQCGKSTLIWMRGNSAGLVPMYCDRVIGEHKCKFCVQRRYEMVEKRISENAERIYTQEVCSKQATKISRYYRERDLWFSKMPLSNGTFAIVANAPGPEKLSGTELPMESLRETITAYLDDTPEGKRISFTRKTEQDDKQKEKCLVLTTGSSRRKLVEILAQSGYTGRAQDDQFVYSIASEKRQEMLVALGSAGISLTVSNGDIEEDDRHISPL